MSKIEAIRTPWGDDHKSIRLNMLALLERYGIAESYVRERVTAHAILASGWKQNCFNHNAWGVKRGSWAGNYVVLSTYEEINKERIKVEGAEWRAFDNWRSAIDDYFKRINVENNRYSSAAKALYSRLIDCDKTFFDQLRVAGYFTDTGMSAGEFQSIVNGIRDEWKNATPADLKSADDFAKGAILIAPMSQRITPLGWIVIASAIIGAIWIFYSIAKKK